MTTSRGVLIAAVLALAGGCDGEAGWVTDDGGLVAETGTGTDLGTNSGEGGPSLDALKGCDPQTFTLSPDAAARLLNDAVSAARGLGLPWDGEIVLTPSGQLIELVRRSQELAAASGEGDG